MNFKKITFSFIFIFIMPMNGHLIATGNDIAYLLILMQVPWLITMINEEAT